MSAADPIRRPLALSMGDPAGIGPEVIGKAWLEREAANLPCFFAVGDMRAIAAACACEVIRIDDPDQAWSAFPRGVPVLQVEDTEDIHPGRPTAVGARCALDSLELAAGLARSGAAQALVTAPVSKEWMYGIGFGHPGQTEFIAERCGIARENAVMMLAGPSLRTVPVTVHEPLAEVPRLITAELIVARGRVTARALQRDFGIAEPRLVIAGLNPHAGEAGALGREEIEVIAPAVEQLRAEGIDVLGPLAADTLFHPRARARYDAALCLYHDQALIPIKTLHFDEGVNVTLGLPIVRTSPDHGTAFEIAGQDRAHPGAMIAAIALAGECAERRAQAR